MKQLKTILYIMVFLLLLSCSGYGDKLQYLQTEVYYTSKVDKVEAEKLGEFLVRSEFAGDNEKSIQLSKNDTNGHYQFRMVTSKEAAESKSYETIFKLYAKQLSDSVFNKQPVDFHVCDNKFKTLKVIPFNNE